MSRFIISKLGQYALVLWIAITLNWLWAYFTFQRGSRLITGPTPLPSQIEREVGGPWE